MYFPSKRRYCNSVTLLECAQGTKSVSRNIALLQELVPASYLLYRAPHQAPLQILVGH